MFPRPYIQSQIMIESVRSHVEGGRGGARSVAAAVGMHVRGSRSPPTVAAFIRRSGHKAHTAMTRCIPGNTCYNQGPFGVLYGWVDPHASIDGTSRPSPSPAAPTCRHLLLSWCLSHPLCLATCPSLDAPLRQAGCFSGRPTTRAIRGRSSSSPTPTAEAGLYGGRSPKPPPTAPEKRPR